MTSTILGSIVLGFTHLRSFKFFKISMRGFVFNGLLVVVYDSCFRCLKTKETLCSEHIPETTQCMTYPVIAYKA